MNLHLISFLAVVVVSFTSSMLITAVVIRFDPENDSDTKLRLQIAYACFQLMSLPMWNVVQYLILYAIVMYGKPLEEDSQKLLSIKLATMFKDQSVSASADSHQVQFERRQNEYRRLANE